MTENEMVGWHHQLNGLESEEASGAWKIPQTEEPGRLQSMGSLRVGHDCAASLSLSTFIRGSQAPRRAVCGTRGSLRTMHGGGSAPSCQGWGGVGFTSCGSWAVEHRIESEVTESCPTLSNPMDCSLPGSSVCGIFQARVLEWVAISFSNV